MGEEVAMPEVELAGIAARQHGAVTVGQLRELGLDKSAVTRRVRAGRLHRVHRGVYAVGHAELSREGRWMAAVLALGPGAALSHRSAAAHWRLLEPVRGPVDVSVPSLGGRERRSGIRVHRRPWTDRSCVVWRHRIPVTPPAQTIADLRGAVPPWQLRRAIRQAEMAGYRLAPDIPRDRTRSDLERDFLRLCRRHGIPDPEVNVKVGRWTVDFLWREARIAVETDFYGYHRGRVAFRDDRRRDLELRRAGFAVHHFSEEQVNDRPVEVIADLRVALGLAS